MGDPSKTIENILLNLKKREIRTMEQLNMERNSKIDEIMDDFMCYPKNQENIKKIKEELKDFEVVSIDTVYKDDILFYLDTYYFFDILLAKIKIIGIKDEGKIRIKRWTQNKHGVYKTINTPAVMFRKLTEEDKVKINLVETVYSMK